MTIKEIMQQYFMGEMDAISVIRLLSGMFDPKNAINLLTLICTITRHEQGDIDSETFNEVWKLNIDLNNKKSPNETILSHSELKSAYSKLKNKKDKVCKLVNKMCNEISDNFGDYNPDKMKELMGNYEQEIAKIKEESDA